jgi:hypothetical protein
MDDRPKEQIEEGLRKVLNAHGYGFHYAILRKAYNLHCEGKSKWVFEAAEYPVAVKGFDTRIDFILRTSYEYSPPGSCFLVAECERVNPALSHWCFVRTPYIRRNRSDQIMMERLIGSYPNGARAGGNQMFHDEKNTYHLGVEISSGGKGDTLGRGRGSIEEAATQVCKCLNGLVEGYRKDEQQFLPRGSVIDFLPVIFTTAQIWTSDVDIGEADLLTGQLDLKGMDVKQRSWIWLQYHLSPGIKHTVDSYNAPQNLGDILAHDYIRTIAVAAI